MGGNSSHRPTFFSDMQQLIVVSNHQCNASNLNCSKAQSQFELSLAQVSLSLVPNKPNCSIFVQTLERFANPSSSLLGVFENFLYYRIIHVKCLIFSAENRKTVHYLYNCPVVGWELSEYLVYDMIYSQTLLGNINNTLFVPYIFVVWIRSTFYLLYKLSKNTS